MGRTLNDLSYAGPHGLKFTPFGEILRTRCPVCGSRDIDNVFRLPIAQIEPPITLFNGYFNEIPVLRTPFRIHAWDLCHLCNCIFLNPAPERSRTNQIYRESTSYLEKMKDERTWSGHEERYDALLKFAPAGARVLIDAACGGGHSLFLARKGRGWSWDKLVGLELSESYVANLRASGIEAHQFDLDRDDPRRVLPSGAADLISFQEAFEHVERPFAVLAKLLDWLRTGGRLYFSAQRYGDDVNLPLLAGEPIYIGPRVVELLPTLLPCTVVNVEKYGPRYLIALERTAAPVTAEHLEIGLEESPVSEQDNQAAEGVRLKPPFAHDGGHCWSVDLRLLANASALATVADMPGARAQSPLVVLEDGKAIGKPHAVHDEIRRTGGGLYSHWRTALYFSTSDNSNPNRNGRSYALLCQEATTSS
jgi:SAM-dependent methyltransferase